MSVISNIPTVGSMVLLLQLISVCLFSGTGISEEIVVTEHNITLEVGTRGILPCHFQGRSSEVEWKKQRTPNFELLVSLDTLFNVGARDGPGYKAGLFNITDNYSLVINEVKVQDQGIYICIVSDLETGIPIRKWTRVYVQASPDQPFPLIQACIGKYIHPGACTLTVDTSSPLTCLVEGYYPDIELYFLHGSEKVAFLEYREWNNTNWTKNKDISIRVSVSDEPYQCVASALPGINGNRTVSVFVQHFQAKPQLHSAAAVFISVLIMLFLVGVGLFISRIFKRYSGNRREFPYRMLSKEEFQANIEHILWEISKTKLIELLKTLKIDHEAISDIANEERRSVVFETAHNKLWDWGNQLELDSNPIDTLRLTLDDLGCESSFLKIPMSEKKEINEKELMDLCCQITRNHYMYFMKAIHGDVHRVAHYQIMRFVHENNESLFNTIQMLRDWAQGEECSSYEKRCKLKKAVGAIAHRDLKDAKRPSDDELRVIARFLSSATMGQLCTKLGIKRPSHEANEEERFKALIEWRDNHASSKDLKEKHSDLFCALEEINQGGTLSRIQGQFVYKAELVDLAFHLLAQVLLPFTEALGISADRLIPYKCAFRPSNMKKGTISLVCKLFRKVFDNETEQRSQFCSLLNQMPYPNVSTSGVLGDNNVGTIPFTFICNILRTMNPKQRCILANLIRDAPSSPVGARLLIFPMEEEKWARLADDKVSRNLHAWIEKWILQMIQSKGDKDNVGFLSATDIARNHRDFNDKLVDYGFFDLAYEIMICEQQLIDGDRR